MKTIVEIKQDLKQFDRKQLYKDKVAKMQRSMADMGIDAVVCFKPQNTFYLSGFNPIEVPAGANHISNGAYGV